MAARAGKKLIHEQAPGRVFVLIFYFFLFSCGLNNQLDQRHTRPCKFMRDLAALPPRAEQSRLWTRAISVQAASFYANLRRVYSRMHQPPVDVVHDVHVISHLCRSIDFFNQFSNKLSSSPSRTLIVDVENSKIMRGTVSRVVSSLGSF